MFYTYALKKKYLEAQYSFNTHASGIPCKNWICFGGVQDKLLTLWIRKIQCAFMVHTALLQNTSLWKHKACMEVLYILVDSILEATWISCFWLIVKYCLLIQMSTSCKKYNKYCQNSIEESLALIKLIKLWTALVHSYCNTKTTSVACFCNLEHVS